MRIIYMYENYIKYDRNQPITWRKSGFFKRVFLMFLVLSCSISFMLSFSMPLIDDKHSKTSLKVSRRGRVIRKNKIVGIAYFLNLSLTL